MSIDANTYPPILAALLRRLPLAPLGPGHPDASMRPALEALANHRVADTCRAGLWLAFDFLDESHKLSQDIDTPEGSFWHAILHRREPDASNSKYWWRRVGTHTVFQELAIAAAVLGHGQPGDAWDPFAFVDRCEKTRGTGSAEEQTCQLVQRAEWELLFAWCYRQSANEPNS